MSEPRGPSRRQKAGASPSFIAARSCPTLGPYAETAGHTVPGRLRLVSGQTDYKHRWLINPQTGEIVLWTAEGGIDGQTPVDLDDLDLVCIEPQPSYIWYQDMADSSRGSVTTGVGRKLTRAIQGRGAFRRFKDEVHEEYPHLLPVWHGFAKSAPNAGRLNGSSTTRSLTTNRLPRFVTEHPDPDLP